MDEKIPTISVASVEILVAHYVRIIKWLVVALVISIVLMFGSFVVSYFGGTEIVETQEIGATQEGGGTNILSGCDVSYGQTDGVYP